MRLEYDLFVPPASIVAAIVAAGLVVASAAGGGASEGAKLSAIRTRGRLVISVKNRGPEAADLHRDPAHFQKRGYELDLARDITRAIFGDDTKMLLKILPRPMRLPALASGDVDLVISMLAVPPTPTKEIDYSHPYLVGGLQLMAPRASSLRRLEDLNGKRVAAVRESAHDPGAELKTLAAARGLHLDVGYFANFQQATAAIGRGEAAAMVSMDANVDAFVADNADYVRVGTLLDRRAYAVGVRRGDDDLLALVNGVVDKLRQSGELKRRAGQWKLPYLLDAR